MKRPDDFQLEIRMEQWLSHELESAPDIFPSQKVRNTLREWEHKPRRIPSPRTLRWAAAGMASAAAVILFFVLPPPFDPGEFSPNMRLEYAPSRQGPVAGPIAKRGKGGQGKKQDTTVFQNLEFQYQSSGSPDIQGVDMRDTPESEMILDSDYNFRIMFRIRTPASLNMFLLDSRKKLVRLFPRSMAAAEIGLLKTEQNYLIPDFSQWYHTDEVPGPYILYVLLSASPEQRWEKVYARYRREKNFQKQQNLLTGILLEWGNLKENIPGDPAVYTYSFQNR